MQAKPPRNPLHCCIVALSTGLKSIRKYIYYILLYVSLHSARVQECNGATESEAVEIALLSRPFLSVSVNQELTN